MTLTSFGSGPNAVGYSVVQAEVRTALNGIGVAAARRDHASRPTVDFEPLTSNAHKLDGDDASANGCFPTIAVSSTPAVAQVKKEIAKRRVPQRAATRAKVRA